MNGHNECEDLPLPIVAHCPPLAIPQVSHAPATSLTVATQQPAPAVTSQNCDTTTPYPSAAASLAPFGPTHAAAPSLVNIADADRSPVRARIPLPKAPPQRQRQPAAAPRHKLLVLCGGPNDRPDGLVALLRESGMSAVNYDTVNGSDWDLVDTYIFDNLIRAVDASAFDALFASPPCTPFSVLHQRPGRGSPPMVTATGSERYGIRGLPPKTAESVKAMMLVCIRVATIVKRFVIARRPVLFETAAFIYEGQTSVFNLDE